MGYRIPAFELRPYMDVVELAKTRIMPLTGQPYSFDMTPYFEEPCRYLDDVASTCRVVISAPSQSGKSEIMLNFVAHVAIYDPAPSLLIMDTSNNSYKFSSGRLKPLLRDFVKLPAFEDTSVSNRNDDKKKAVSEYSLSNNSPLYIGGSVSLSDLCSKPCKYLVLDELARFYEGKEGSSVDLALKRQMRFRGMALLTSTPTVADNYITQYWRSGTAQTWGVICPDCGKWFTCFYDKIIFDDVTEPCYACPHCGTVHSEHDIVSARHCFCDPTNDNPYRDRFGRVSRSFEITGEMCHAFFTPTFSWPPVASSAPWYR